MFIVSDSPLDAAAILAGIDDPESGGLVVFEGRVRNHHQGRAVLRLEYESFRPLAEKEGNRIIAEAAERFEIRAARCSHRVGLLEVGDVAVVVAVAAAHRGAAFEACQYLIDELKARVPVWKKEYYADGSTEWTRCDRPVLPGDQRTGGL